MTDFTLPPKAIEEVVGLIQDGLVLEKDVTSDLREVEVTVDDSIYTMSDVVLARFGQIIHEAVFTGTNIVDHMRMMKLEVDSNDSTKLTLTNQYVADVEKRLEDQAAVGKTLKEEAEFGNEEHIVRGED
jgi:hypothetical protein